MREETILRKIRKRDPTGLEALMERYIPYVSAVAWNILRNAMAREDAEEVVSDVFLAAWEQAEDLRAGFVKQWLGAVARNKAKNRLRRLGHELPLEEDILEIPGPDDPAADAESAEERKLVHRAVKTLPEPDREIFLRHYYYAQTVREISHTMALNESTVKTKLRRGRMRLKNMLMRWGVR
ncbi:MAG: RNA polymerase sigma factor [Oscillospiraceae bacterium]|nr:RNA polymerase sigma factor [Oscillospiraceae bacterium]